MATPHRVVDSIADGIANGVKGLFSSGINALKGAGNTIVNAVDKPLKDVTGKEGPLMAVNRFANGVADTTVNVVDNGIIGNMQNAGEAVMKTLDHPVDQFGIPPDIEKMGMGLFKGIKK